MIQYLYEFKYPPDIIPTIDFKKDTEDRRLKKENFDIFHDYNKNIVKVYKRNNTKGKDIKRKIEIAEDNKLGPLSQNILSFVEPENIPTIHVSFQDLQNSFDTSIDDVFIELKQERIELKEKNKFDNLKFMMMGEKVYKLVRNYKYCDREKMILQYRLKVIYQLYDYLKIGGNFITAHMNICSVEQINYIYLLSLLFDRIILIDGTIVHCFGFLGEKGVSRDKFLTLSNQKFYIHPKPNMESMVHYIRENIIYRMKKKKLLEDHKYQKYIDDSFDRILSAYMETSLDSKKIKIVLDNYLLYLKMQKTQEWIINFMRDTRKKEIDYIHSLLNDVQIRYMSRILKIGMSYGMYEEVFLKAKPGLQLKIVSKDQNNYWEKVGIEYLESKGYKDQIELMNEDIFYALPKLLQNYGESSMDIIFIEEVLSIDKMIYLWMHFGLMIRMFGLIIFDKMVNPTLYNFFDFINKNYPTLKKIETDSGLVVYKKINRFALDTMIYSF